MKTSTAKTVPLATAILATGIAFTLHAETVHPPKPVEVASTNLESNIDGVALRNDANIGTPWGVAVGVQFHHIFVADNETGVISVYLTNGAPREVSNNPLAITVPAVQTGGTGSPTGVWVVETAAIKNSPLAFPLPIPGGSGSVSAYVLSVTLDGEIVGWTDKIADFGTTAVVAKTVAGASYTGLALTDAIVGNATATSHLLYAANAKTGNVDVFDDTFTPVTTLAGSFTDPNPVAGYVPSNIKQFRAKDPVSKKTTFYLLVAYAKAGTGTLFEEGAGFGYINLFKADGTFLSRLVDVNGLLDMPWGMVVDPTGFMVANHGDGTILRYDLTSFAPGATALQDPHPLQNLFGQPLAISGVWGMHYDYKTFSPAAYLADGEAAVVDATSFVFGGEPIEGEGLVGRLKK